MIETLKDKQIFVFGSNILGAHAGGAALKAFEDFGAEYGVGEGLTGKCYAFPTLDQNMQRYTVIELKSITEAFMRCVIAHPEFTFLLTRVGMGIASYSIHQIAPLFAETPSNVIVPEEFARFNDAKKKSL